MVKRFLAVTLSMGSLGCWAASPAHPDTTRIEALNDVVVMGVKAKANAPFAIANVDKKTLSTFSKSGQELPFLFSRTPGVTAWSDNGLGTGTTYMRIRGTGDSRINITIDGVPLNSPEDQCVFWANMNSYSSLLSSVQIQRGVGTSTNGDGAFGGTVSMTTKSPAETPSLEVTGSYGSYNTFNIGGSFSSGLLLNHLIVDGAYHETQTDGFIHGTDGRSGSYYGGLTFVDDDRDIIIRYKNIGNFETTGQAWNGVTAGNDGYSLNMKNGFKTYEDMYNAGLGKFNSLYESFNPDENGGWTTSRYTMADGSLWDKTTDNFWQNHNILSLAWQINDNWKTTGSVHYTHGHGYYKEFRPNKELNSFGLSNLVLSDGSTLKKTDFVRKKGLTQDSYGIIWNINYTDESWDITGGLSMQNFEGNHYGYVTYIKNEELRQAVIGNGDYKYYDSDATKSDQNIFVKALYHLCPSFDVFADVQFRHVGYITTGINDRFVSLSSGGFANQILDINEKYNFLNPKVGVSFHENGHNAYASFARSNREPERNNFTDNYNYPAPVAEQLNDFELGYNYNGKNVFAGVNFYYMDYKDQFVQTGMKSDIGENLTTNIKDSYRAGIEISAGWNPFKWLTLEGNAALSKNRIKNFDEYVETYDEDWGDLPMTVIHHDNSTLAFSPSTILNGFVNFHYKGFEGVWHTNFVSRQYLDNTENKDRSLPSYSATNIYLNYTLDCQRKLIGIKETVLGLNFNNIFNKHYAASGWVYSALVGSTYTNENRYYLTGYVPMAGFNVMGSVTLRF